MELLSSVLWKRALGSLVAYSALGIFMCWYWHSTADLTLWHCILSKQVPPQQLNNALRRNKTLRPKLWHQETQNGPQIRPPRKIMMFPISSKHSPKVLKHFRKHTNSATILVCKRRQWCQSCLGPMTFALAGCLAGHYVITEDFPVLLRG
jgi:hypothetical protein